MRGSHFESLDLTQQHAHAWKISELAWTRQSDSEGQDKAYLKDKTKRV